MNSIRLPYPFTKENMPLYAQDFVETVQRVDGVQLDYSVASISYIDDLIESFRGEDAPEPERTLVLAGAYVGECMRHEARGWWTETEGVSVKFTPWPVCLRIGPKYCDPIGKSFKRFKLGAGDSMAYFAHVFLDRRSPVNTPKQNGGETS